MLRLKCRECGYIIYQGEFMGTDTIFSSIRRRNDGRVRCPGCDRKLTLRGNKITITPAQEFL